LKYNAQNKLIISAERNDKNFKPVLNNKIIDKYNSTAFIIATQITGIWKATKGINKIENPGPFPK
jgi:hypothetical protein